MTPTTYQLGQAQAYFHKYAGDARTVYSLTGELYVTPKNWGLLSVPNALVRGAFDALHELGAELPLNSEGRLNAHITCFRPEEIERIGGPDKLQERGKRFTFNLGPLQECEPDGWDEYSRVWFLKVDSPEIRQLRKSYGLTPLPNDNKFDFHITIGRRRKKVLQHNEVTKQSTFEEENAKARERDKDSYLPHVRDGYAICSCGNRYHVIPPDYKCPECGGKIVCVRSAHKQAALVSVPELSPTHPDYPKKKKTEDLIPGGLSDSKPPSAFPAAVVRQGQKVESEHTSSPAVAREIARDHLTEDPRYYDKLDLVEEGGPVIDQLLRAKALSDRGNYAGKHRILSQLIRRAPADFLVDDSAAYHPGLTHTPTGFRFHAPAGLAGLVAPKLATRRFVPADANDPSDREDCPHCGTLHERDNGRCNRCGELWPAVTKSAAGRFGPLSLMARRSGPLASPKPTPFKLTTPKPTATSTPKPAAPKPATPAPMPAPAPVPSAVPPAPPAAPLPTGNRDGGGLFGAPVRAVKNQFGFGRGGPLEGVSPVRPTASPVGARLPKGIKTVSPKAWTGYAANRAVRPLEQGSSVGRFFGTVGRSLTHAVTTNPVRSVADAVRPGSGRWLSPFSRGMAATPLAYAGYKAQRALPDQVDAELEQAGVDKSVRDDQWWRTWGTQPKLLYRSVAPVEWGGDDTAVGRIPRRVAEKMVVDTPHKLEHLGLVRKPVDAGAAVKPPSSYLPTPANALQATVFKNVAANLEEGMPAIARDVAVDTGRDVLQDPKQLQRSTALRDLKDGIDPRLYNDPVIRDKILRSYLGDAADAVKDEAITLAKPLQAKAELTTFMAGAPASHMQPAQYQDGTRIYIGRTADGRNVQHNPVTGKSWVSEPNSQEGWLPVTKLPPMVPLGK